MVDRREHRHPLDGQPARGLAAFADAAKHDLAKRWVDRISIRTPDADDNILSLSGGNQQKALFARALGSDARIILMDDPMRGVDYATKLEVYDLIRAEARAGRTFLWYTTETEELDNCDRVYVFRNGRIVAKLGPDDITEEKVIQSSFQEATMPEMTGPVSHGRRRRPCACRRCLARRRQLRRLARTLLPAFSLASS